MLDWDDEIRLSPLEVEQARRLVVASLDEAIAQTELLLAEVQQLNASPERERLIERILALYVEQLAIKRESLARLDRVLPRTGHVVPVRADMLATIFKRIVQIVGRGYRNSFYTANAHLQSLGMGGAPRSAHALRAARTRGLDVVASVLRREAASRLISRCGQHGRLSHARPFHSRSTASRSRMLAPVGAPPGLLSRS